MEFNESELKEFRFNLTLEIQNLIIDMFLKKQMLEEENGIGKSKKLSIICI